MNPQEIKKLEDKILATLKNHLHPGDTVIAGISGGPDSIFLLYLLEKLPIRIIVAHVNHQLRKEAGADEEFVKKLCKNANNENPVRLCIHDKRPNIFPHPSTLIFAPLTIDIKALSQKSKQGLEETGRKIRYNFFQKLANKHQSKFIITAHHADDNLETIILNFARGASLQGLGGMQECEKISSKFTLLRPLLSISKNQILDFLHCKKLEFRVDKSNNSLVYKRNFIRHKIIPLLKKINPNISTTLAKNSANLREINEFLLLSAQDWIKKNALESQDSIPKKLNGKNFRLLPQALQKIILLQIHEQHFGHTQNIQSSNLEEALSLINKNIGNKKKKFGQLTISIKNNIITLI